MPRVPRFPKYPTRPHKTGQARIRVAGEEVYLGVHGSPQSWTRYREELARWQAQGEKAPLPHSEAELVQHVIAAHVAHIREEVKAGHLSEFAERDCMAAYAALLRLHGSTPVSLFGPRQFRDVGQAMLAGSWLNAEEKVARQKNGNALTCSRKTVNHRMRRIRKAFKWSASQELVALEVYQRLTTVDGFRVSAEVEEEVEPVDPETVEKTLAHLGPVVGAMVRLQLLTGMRPGEVCALTASQIHRDGLKVEGVPIWVYRPTHDKQSHRRKPVPIALGPKAQQVIEPFMGRSGFLFSPLEEMEAIAQKRHAEARFPRKRKGFQNRTFTDGYTIQKYYTRIRRVCAAQGIPHWHPNQLRHTAEVNVERAFNLDAARAVLRHRDAKTTTRYGIIDLQKAAEVAAKIG